MLFQDVRNGRRNVNNWASEIKIILDDLGYSDVWINQFDLLPNISVLKERLYDQFKQLWHTKVFESSRLQYYAIFKDNFVTESEKYLHVLNDWKLRTALSRLRVSSHDLQIENGRYHNIPRENRKCVLCNLNQVESEFHFVMVCPLFTDLRRKYLPRFCWNFASHQKFKLLLSSQSKKNIVNLAKFLYQAFLRREINL